MINPLLLSSRSRTPSRLLTDKVTNKIWNISQILIKQMRHHHNWILKFGTRTLRLAILVKTWKFYRNIRNFFVCLESFPFMFFIKRQKSFIKIIKQKNAFVTWDCVTFCLSFRPQSLSTCRLCVPTWAPDFLTWMELERLINRYDQIWSWEFSLKGQALGWKSC